MYAGALSYSSERCVTCVISQSESFDVRIWKVVLIFNASLPVCEGASACGVMVDCGGDGGVQPF